jgi:hypothetical protein
MKGLFNPSGWFNRHRSEIDASQRVILAEIPRETLNTVFLEWIEQLQKCVQVDGEHVG